MSKLILYKDYSIIVTQNTFIAIKQIKSEDNLNEASAVFTDVSGSEHRWPSLIDSKEGGISLIRPFQIFCLLHSYQ